MRSGRLKHRVTFERQSTTLDDWGETADSWTPLATVWAAVEPISGREYYAASGENSEVSTRILCRYDSALAALAPKDRARVGAAEYRILAVINRDLANKELELMCAAVARDG